MGTWHKVCCCLAATVALNASAATLTVDKVQQRYPWNGLVDIDYTITNPDNVAFGPDDNLEVLMIDKSVTPVVTNRAFSFLQTPLPFTVGNHRITWDAHADGVTNHTDMASVVMMVVHYAPVYMVIDVSGGPNTNVYPVTFCNGEPQGGFTADEYKGDKIVLRRIHQGSYMAGSPYGEFNHNDIREKQHSVGVLKPFYIGIFEVTQRQYENIMGDNPSENTGEYRPVEMVSYDMIRGAAKTSSHQYDWPWTNGVDASSFMGKLRSKCKAKDSNGDYTVDVTGFDLPTEFQWEYACRAGTTGAFNTTNEYANTSAGQQAALNLLGRYKGNGGTENKHAVVGSYRPNLWGLYDMHGNVWEWCLDWFVEDPTTELDPRQYLDPVGAATGEKRAIRGGGWDYAVADCRSARRDRSGSNSTFGFFGFRLSITLP